VSVVSAFCWVAHTFVAYKRNCWKTNSSFTIALVALQHTSALAVRKVF